MRHDRRGFAGTYRTVTGDNALMASQRAVTASVVNLLTNFEPQSFLFRGRRFGRSQVSDILVEPRQPVASPERQAAKLSFLPIVPGGVAVIRVNETGKGEAADKAGKQRV
jgi:hypothetical protein